jgi:hypothetical protein
MVERVVGICVLFCVLASADVSDIVLPMWAQLRAHTSRVGDLSTINSFDRRTINAVKNTTECEIRLLAYEHALHIVSSQRAASKMVEVFDALQLSTMCSVTRPTPIPGELAPSAVLIQIHTNADYCLVPFFYLEPNH